MAPFFCFKLGQHFETYLIYHWTKVEARINNYWMGPTCR